MAQQGAGAERLVAVVVTHDRLDQLRITLARLLEAEPETLQAIVVFDNASTDGTKAWLATQDDPRLMVERSATNRGGAGGFEAGMRLATERFDPDWILVMDDDARPHPGALAAFHALDKTGQDAVAAAVYLPDGRICEMNRPARNPFWHRAAFLSTLRRGRDGFHFGPDAYRPGNHVQVDVASFVGFFVSRAGIARAGYPDPSLFIYADDSLYTLNLAGDGGRILFAPEIVFEHDCSTFGAEQRGRFRPLWKTYYHYRNLLMLYRAAAGWLFWPALLLIVPKWLLKVRAHGGERGRFLGLVARALRDGLLGRRDVDHATVRGWAEGG